MASLTGPPQRSEGPVAMRSSFARRLGALEAQMEGDAGRCSECGGGGSWSDLTYEVVWDCEGTDGPPPEPQKCARCGRALELFGIWADLSRETGGPRAERRQQEEASGLRGLLESPRGVGS